MKRTPIKRVNAKRRARLYERNFGDKAAWIRAQPCEVTGVLGVDPAHVKARGMGGCGGSKDDLVPLSRPVHRDFDEMAAEKFATKYGRTKQTIGDAAEWYETAWQIHQSEEAT